MFERIKNKVFFIGFNKTGTVSYHNIMKVIVGKRATHRAIWTDWAYCSNKENLDQYDVFTDGECANVQNLDKLYPNSKFILNTRSLADWLISRHKSIERSRRLNKWIFRRYLPLSSLLNYVNSHLLDNGDSAMKRWVQIRNAYHCYVLDYFKNREDRFLVLDLADEDALPKLQKFLDLDKPLTHYHKNISGKDLKSGALFDVLGFLHKEERSRKKVHGFLRREGLLAYKDEKLISGGKANIPIKVPPSTSQKPSFLVRYFVSKRASSQSIFARFFYDQFIRIFRSDIKDMNGFIPIYRYGGGAK